MCVTGVNISSQNAANISIYYDVGGVIGGILAGIAADFTGMSASVCSIMLVAAIPTVNNIWDIYVYHNLILILNT